jgi:hypothetical protein
VGLGVTPPLGKYMKTLWEQYPFVSGFGGWGGQPYCRRIWETIMNIMKAYGAGRPSAAEPLEYEAIFISSDILVILWRSRSLQALWEDNLFYMLRGGAYAPVRSRTLPYASLSNLQTRGNAVQFYLRSSRIDERFWGAGSTFPFAQEFWEHIGNPYTLTILEKLQIHYYFWSFW